MKSMFLLIFIHCCCIGFGQTNGQLKNIDSMVANINAATVPMQHDTLVQNHPDLGLYMTTYLSSLVQDGHLIKFQNQVKAVMTENGTTREMTTSNTFYWNQQHLIKVEEYMLEGDNKQTADWYYAADQPLHYTMQSDKAADRAKLLLTMAKQMQQKYTR